MQRVTEQATNWAVSQSVYGVCAVICGPQVIPQVKQTRFSEPAAPAAPAVEEPDPLDLFMAQNQPAAAPATAAAAAPGGSKAVIRPGSSGGKRNSAASKGAKGKQPQRRRFYDTSSESDWTDSEVRGCF